MHIDHIYLIPKKNQFWEKRDFDAKFLYERFHMYMYYYTYNELCEHFESQQILRLLNIIHILSSLFFTWMSIMCSLL